MSIASLNSIKRKTLFCLNNTRATYVYFKSFWYFHLNRDSKLQTLCSCRHGVMRFMTSFRWESYYFGMEWGKKLNISTYSIFSKVLKSYPAKFFQSFEIISSECFSKSQIPSILKCSHVEILANWDFTKW